MGGSIKSKCENCGKLTARVGELEKQLADIQDQLAKATKNSATSSKPPSSDITNPPPKRKKRGRPKKRKIGGQPGHKRHQRIPFLDEQVDKILEYRYTACPCCGGGNLQDGDQRPKKLQQVELAEQPITIQEHHGIGQVCLDCGEAYTCPLPEDILRSGLVGPRMTALIGWLKGVCHMSIGNIRKYCRDVIGVKLSRGLIQKLVTKVSQSLKSPYDQLLDALSDESHLNIDETGHKDNGKRLWTWCFRAYLFTVFKISPSRGSNVLLETLGEDFDGVIGCDYFSAYRKFMRLDENVKLQFCIAHLIRDIKFLCAHPDPQNQQYGAVLREHFRKLFKTIARREEFASDANFRRSLDRIRRAIVWDATMEQPDTQHAANMANRFYLHCESYFRFISDPAIGPTNNVAEQAIRFVAIHRRMTQGTRGEVGQSWYERICTVVVTCEQQGCSVLEFITESVRCLFSGESSPSLLPIAAADTS
jgi:transposase